MKDEGEDNYREVAKWPVCKKMLQTGKIKGRYYVRLSYSKSCFLAPPPINKKPKKGINKKS